MAKIQAARISATDIMEVERGMRQAADLGLQREVVKMLTEPSDTETHPLSVDHQLQQMVIYLVLSNTATCSKLK
jgi:hypothetical protein